MHIQNGIEQILATIYPEIKSAQNVVIANGRYPEAQYLQDIIGTAEKLICCDGAIHQLMQYKITPDYIIGDCDSIDLNAVDTKIKIIQVADQNSNDLTKAVMLAKELGLNGLVIFGATGLREDHAIANIALLYHYTTIIDHIAMITDHGIFTAHHAKNATMHTFSLNTIPGQQISFFTCDANAKISCSNLKWPLDQHQFNFWFQGTLNQATSDHIDCNIDGGSVLVYRSFEIYS